MRLRVYQIALLLAFFAFWYVGTHPTLVPPVYFDDGTKAAFFFGEPIKVMKRLLQWFISGEIYEHLWVTLLETILAFLIGTSLGVAVGLWLGLSSFASMVLDPHI